MHSPEVLAFSIVRPWPDIIKQPMRRNAPKWQLPIVRRDDGSFFISRFAYFNGHELYWPSMFDIWHMEPGGKDSLTVCKHRITDSDGKFVRWSNAWRWHVWHWKVTPVFIYTIRRRLLTRCMECGKGDRKGNRVNHSDGGRTSTPIWLGELGLYHSACLEAVHKRRHEHDPRGCYACSGKASFEFNRRDALPKTLPAINPFMPPKQRELLSSLHVAVDLGFSTQEAAIKTYAANKKAATWH